MAPWPFNLVQNEPCKVAAASVLVVGRRFGRQSDERRFKQCSDRQNATGVVQTGCFFGPDVGRPHRDRPVHRHVV
jgi:hypothetical protein